MTRLWRLKIFGMWWATRQCVHPESWRRSRLIDSGRAKMFWCTVCEKTWFT